VPDQALDTFIFTRPNQAKSWRLDVPDGDYQVAVSVGDAAFPVGPQQVVFEGQLVIDEIHTSTGSFFSATGCAHVADGTASMTIGGLTGYTCLNWVKVIGTACGNAP
jgi:hypothetical protein